MSNLIKINDPKQFKQLILSQPKLRDNTDEQLFSQTVLYCIKSVGAEPPEDADRKLLKSFILSNYDGYTIEEFRLAFDMACVGKLEVNLDHYNKFTPEYFGRIMKAYTNWRGKKLASNTTSLPKKSKGLSREETFQFFEKNFFKPYRDAKKGKWSFTDFQSFTMYGNLERMGFEIMPVEEKQELYKQKLKDFRYLRTKDEIEKQAKRECKKIAFRDFILGCAMEDRDLESEIKSLL